MNLTQRMLAASAVLLFGSMMYACGGGTSIASGTLTQADFDTMLAASDTFKSVSSDTSTLKGQMGRIGLFGHVKKVATKAEITMSVTQSVTPNFGPCTDMGVLQGRSGGPNAMLGAIQSYQTCLGYEYSVSADTGAIQPSIAIEWSQTGCQGTPYEPSGLINKQLATNGAVFVIVSTGAIVQITAGEATSSHAVSSQEDDLGRCEDFPSPLTQDFYNLVANDTSITGVPNSSIPVPFSNGAP